MTDTFPTTKYNYCDGTGWVCENHPTIAWGGVDDGTITCDCGAGMPCSGCLGCSLTKIRTSGSQHDGKSA